MSAINTFQTLNANFKEIYADKIKNLVPDNVKVLNEIAFLERAKLGQNYHQPVILQHEHGITFFDDSDSSQNLAPAVSGAIKDATVRGHGAILRSQISYQAASRAVASNAAFEGSMKVVVANMLRSMAKKLEIQMMYGQVGYGIVSAVSGTLITIQTSEWAPGIWAGSEGMPLEIRDTTGATSRGNYNVVAANLDTRVITLDVATVGVVVGDVVWHAGAYGLEFAGIHKILTQASGTLFGINVASYNLFRGNQYSASSSALSFTKINNALVKGIEKGQDGKLLALVNPRAWSNMLNDQAALRRYDGSYSKKKSENGAEVLEFTSQNGTIEIMASVYVKEGYAYLLNKEDYARIGSTDMTFKRPEKEGEFFLERQDQAAYELRLMCDFALFCSAPGKSTIITDIVNQ